MSLPKFRKLYFPGLISLVCLPILCVCYFESYNVFQRYYAMRIVSADRASLDRLAELSTRNFHVDRFRKYQDITFNGNGATDQIQLNKVGSIIKRLIVTNDTVNGLRVSFGNHARYAEFISVLDVCYQSFNHNLGFVPFEGKILIWHLPTLNVGLRVEGRNLDNDQLFMDWLPIEAHKSLSMSEKLMVELNEIENVIIEFWPSVLAFILMVGFTFFKSRRYLKLRTSV